MSKNMHVTLRGADIKKLILEDKLSLNDLDVAALQKLFDYETAMLCTDEGDIEMLDACAARLDELKGPLISKEEFFNILENKTTAKKPARQFRFKKLLLVAAMAAILAAAITVTAVAVHFNPFDYFKEVIGMGPGGTLDKGNITIHYIDVKEEYATVEEALQSKNIEILYPSVFPEGVTLETIEFSSTASSKEIIHFFTTIPVVNVYVEKNTNPIQVNNYKEEFKAEDYTFYIFNDTPDPSLHYAVCYYNDYYYCVSANSYDNIILILSNLKKS